MRTRVQRGVYIQIDSMVNIIISYHIRCRRKETSWMHFAHDIHIVSIYKTNLSLFNYRYLNCTTIDYNQ